MSKRKTYWKITPEIKIEYNELFEIVKADLSDWEAKLIWYLRQLPHYAAFSFCGSAQKLFEAYQTKLALSEILD